MSAVCPEVMCKLSRLCVSDEEAARLERARVEAEAEAGRFRWFDVIRGQLVAAYNRAPLSAANARQYARALHALTQRGVRYTRVDRVIGSDAFTVCYLHAEADGTLRLLADTFARGIDSCTIEVGTTTPVLVDVTETAVWRYDGPDAV